MSSFGTFERAAAGRWSSLWMVFVVLSGLLVLGTPTIGHATEPEEVIRISTSAGWAAFELDVPLSSEPHGRWAIVFSGEGWQWESSRDELVVAFWALKEGEDGAGFASYGPVWGFEAQAWNGDDNSELVLPMQAAAQTSQFGMFSNTPGKWTVVAAVFPYGREQIVDISLRLSPDVTLNHVASGDDSALTMYKPFGAGEGIGGGLTTGLAGGVYADLGSSRSLIVDGDLFGYFVTGNGGRYRGPDGRTTEADGIMTVVYEGGPGGYEFEVDPFIGRRQARLLAVDVPADWKG